MIAPLFQMISRVIVVILLARYTDALIGYDCDVPYDNGTIISLLETDACHSAREPSVVHKVNIELLEKSDDSTIETLSCRVEVDHTSLENVNLNSARFIKNDRFYLPLNYSVCVYLHVQKKLSLGRYTFDQLEKGVINSRLIPLTVLGQSDKTVFKGTENVHVYIHIEFRYFKSIIDLSKNLVVLPTGTSCSYTNLECTDEEGYQNYWSPSFHEKCKPIEQRSLYRGIAHRIKSQGHPVAYFIVNNNKTVILYVQSTHVLCNSVTYQTEHPRLTIREINSKSIDKKNFVNNMFSSVYHKSSRYVTVVDDSNINVRDVYTTICLDKCLRHEPELRSAMLLAYQDPSSLAYALKGVPGFSARIRGETIQLYRCTAVPVILRATEACFQELPVTLNGHPMYLQPRTRIITRSGTRIACDPIAAAIYRLNNVWYTFSTETERVDEPPALLNPAMLSWGQLQYDPADDPITPSDKNTGRPRDSIKTSKESESSSNFANGILIQLPASTQTRKPNDELSFAGKYLNTFWISVIEIALIILLCLFTLSTTLAYIRKSTSRSLTLGTERNTYPQGIYLEGKEQSSDSSSTTSISHLEELFRETQSFPVEESSPADSELAVSSQIRELRLSYQRLEERLDKIIVRR